MKLMTYNILDGAVDTLDQIIKVVNDESPDYLTLNEANTFAENNNQILKSFALRTGFGHYTLALCGEKDPDVRYQYHVAAFSRSPFINVEVIEPLMRAGILGVVDTDLGEVAIVSTHLTPYSEDLRLPEIERILKCLKPYERSILMGDMNSLSELDGYLNERVNGFNETQIKKFTTDGKLRFDVINMIMNNGLKDAAVLTGKNDMFTAPTKGNTKDVSHSDMRLDYIFLSEDVCPLVDRYEVVKNDLTDISSDHYPIVVELKSK